MTSSPLSSHSSSSTPLLIESPLLLLWEREFHGQQGAGVLFLCPSSQRVLLVKRSQEVNEPGTWGIVGGAIDPGENPQGAALREVTEELGVSPRGLRLIPAFVFSQGDFRYHNFLGIVPKEFEPRLNWEADGYVWAPLNKLPPGLHPEVKALLKNSKDLIAKHLMSSSSLSSSPLPPAGNDSPSLPQGETLIRELISHILGEAAQGAPEARKSGMALWLMDNQKNLSRKSYLDPLEKRDKIAVLFDWNKALSVIALGYQKSLREFENSPFLEKFRPSEFLREGILKSAQGYVKLGPIRTKFNPSLLNPQLVGQSLSEIRLTAAENTWGPLMYDIALGMAFPGYLVSDRRSVSDSAQKVWAFYKDRRPDVVKVPLWNPELFRTLGQQIESLPKIPNLLGDLRELLNRDSANLFDYLVMMCEGIWDIYRGDSEGRGIRDLPIYFQRLTKKTLTEENLQRIQKELQAANYSGAKILQTDGPTFSHIREASRALESVLAQSPLSYAYHLPSAPTQASQAPALAQVLSNTEVFKKELLRMDTEHKALVASKSSTPAEGERRRAPSKAQASRINTKEFERDVKDAARDAGAEYFHRKYSWE